MLKREYDDVENAASEVYGTDVVGEGNCVVGE